MESLTLLEPTGARSHIIEAAAVVDAYSAMTLVSAVPVRDLQRRDLVRSEDTA